MSRAENSELPSYLKVVSLRFITNALQGTWLKNGYSVCSYVVGKFANENGEHLPAGEDTFMLGIGYNNRINTRILGFACIHNR